MATWCECDGTRIPRARGETGGQLGEAGLGGPHPARAWRDLSTPTSRSLAGIGITSTRYRLARRLQLGANV